MMVATTSTPHTRDTSMISRHIMTNTSPSCSAIVCYVVSVRCMDVVWISSLSSSKKREGVRVQLYIIYSQ